MKRFITIALTALIIAYAGVKGGLWWTVKKELDVAAAKMGGFATVEYGDIVISLLDAEVGVDTVTIQPTMTNDRFTIAAVRYRAANLWQLLATAGSVQRSALPESFTIALKQVKIDLDSEVLQMMAPMLRQAAAEPPRSQGFLLRDLDALGCGDIQAFDFSNYVAMGYKAMNLDIDMAVTNDVAQQRMSLRLLLAEPGIYHAKADMRFKLAASPGHASAAVAKFEQLRVTYSDEGYYSLRNAYCARHNKSSEEEYIARNAALLSAAIGGTPSAPMAAAYRDYMRQGGRITLLLAPEEPSDLAGLELYRVEQLFDLLGVQLEIDGKRFGKEDIAWGDVDSSAMAKATRSAPAATTAPRPQPPQLRPRPTPSAQAGITTTARSRYRTISDEQLADHIGRMVKIEMTNGLTREGELLQVEEDTITIIQRVNGGALSFPVARHEIVQAGVLL